MRPLEMLRTLRASTKAIGLLVLFVAALLACATFTALPRCQNQFPLVHVAIALTCVAIGAVFGFLARDLIAVQHDHARTIADNRFSPQTAAINGHATSSPRGLAPVDDQTRRLATRAAQASELSNRQIVEAVATTERLNAFSVEFRSIVRALDDIASRTDALASAAVQPAASSALAVEELCLLARHAAFATRQSGRALEDCIRRNAESADFAVQVATALRVLRSDAHRLAPPTAATTPRERAPARPGSVDPLATADDLIAQSELLIGRVETLLDLAPPSDPPARPAPPALPHVRPNHSSHLPRRGEPPARGSA